MNHDLVRYGSIESYRAVTLPLVPPMSMLRFDSSTERMFRASPAFRLPEIKSFRIVSLHDDVDLSLQMVGNSFESVNDLLATLGVLHEARMQKGEVMPLNLFAYIQKGRTEIRVTINIYRKCIHVTDAFDCNCNNTCSTKTPRIPPGSKVLVV